MMKHFFSLFLLLFVVVIEFAHSENDHDDISIEDYDENSYYNDNHDYYGNSKLKVTATPTWQATSKTVSNILSPCKGGTHLPAGSVNCERCPSGKYSLDGAVDCDLCPPGKYNGVYANSVCTDCPTGKYSAQTASTACTSCAAGKYNEVLGASNCVDCSQSSNSSSGASKCDECPVNQQRDSSGSCVPCPRASSSSGVHLTWRAMGVGNCNTCSRGKFSYSDVRINNYNRYSSCGSCQVGYNSEAGSVGSSSCYPCPRGTYQYTTSVSTLSAGNCKPCPVGTYNRLLGVYSSTGMDTTICNKCETGKYASEEGSSVCTDCSAGKYSRELGAFLEDTCTNCPAGTFTVLPGSADCTVCPSGANSNAGATICTYAAIVISPTRAPQSQPIFASPISTEEHDTNMNMSPWLWVLIFIVFCLLYYCCIRKWRNQQEGNAEYDVVELASTHNETSDNPLFHRTATSTARNLEQGSEH
jgi:hypothetical protein